MQLPLQLGYFGRVLGVGLGRMGNCDRQKQLYDIMFFPVTRNFWRRAIVTAADACARNGSAPGCCARSTGLWNPPPETLDTAIGEHRSSDTVRRYETAGTAKHGLGIGRCPQRARLHRCPLHAIPSCNNVVSRDGLAASLPSASPTTFRNHVRRLLPAKSMPPTSSANSSGLSTTLLAPASAGGQR
jgi:hypothetical protein